MHKRYLLSPLAAAITVLLYGGTALAQDQQDDQEFEGALEEVIVTPNSLQSSGAISACWLMLASIDQSRAANIGVYA